MNQQTFELGEEFTNVEKRRATYKGLGELAEFQNRQRNQMAHLDIARTKPERLRFSILLNYARLKDKGFFDLLELLSQILPSNTRIESFEPAYADEKADYLRGRQRFAGGFARKWLLLCFVFRYALLIAQSFSAMCSEKGKKACWAALGGLVIWLRGS